MTRLSLRSRIAIIAALSAACWAMVLAPMALAWALGWGQ